MRALIAMSGGVDSSVAAKLAINNGYECVGCTMKLYQNADAGLSREHTCCALNDVEDARSVARKLKMPYYVFNFTDDFRSKIIDKFISSYESGITPNPCIDCNRYMKFAKLFDRAKILNCQYIVTGHYARITQDVSGYHLKKALDSSKDQSYVLYSMTQQQLAHTLFPLGLLRKTETRKIAEENGFRNAHKPDSQDICFVPDGDYAKIIELHTGKKSTQGKFIDAEGNILGTHNGIIHYTIGQHTGLGLSLPYAVYVIRINPANNTIVLGPQEDLFNNKALVNEFNWISGKPPKDSIRCRAKIRYRQPEQWVKVTPKSNERVELTFDEPQRAITPGQAAVIYDGDEVLGGGVIV
ncbi:MAG: tRNA 2-thiouridine(34) synthase MnmA [Acidaminococcaceae bacterium]|jgi:tRNA-specific 2-thiouridylase|nr:tRNA 2-thiouridine(34) synthase MnmA [Acidaminococcaceae bacterium]